MTAPVSVVRRFCPGARAVGGRETTLFAMVRFVADGSAGEHYNVVAGWAAPVGFWDQAEIDWTLALAKFDVPYFHMREFAHSIGPFAKWKGKEGTRRRFLETLAEIIRDRLLFGI